MTLHEQIPTAQEFIKSKAGKAHKLSNLLTEFAKLHVQAALKKASEKAFCDYQGLSNDMGGDYYPNKDSILNAYPLTKIK